ncbi:MAG TPA: hypothetical protein VK463_12185 [Desulfomonilaceae bacterium]|nr:hypothetical protein [Desulfomonilaceae bacterium]
MGNGTPDWRGHQQASLDVEVLPLNTRKGVAGGNVLPPLVYATGILVSAGLPRVDNNTSELRFLAGKSDKNSHIGC